MKGKGSAGVRESQNEKVKEHLVSGKSITPLEALRLFGCLRLGARIWDLRRKHGLPVVTEIVKGEQGKHYANIHYKRNRRGIVRRKRRNSL
jgi:hypothetical protein